MFSGSKGHDFSCKHKNHDLLTLASYFGIVMKKRMFVDLRRMI